MWEIQIWSLSWEDALEKEIATLSSILSWKIPWTAETSRLYSPWGCKKLDATERLSTVMSEGCPSRCWVMHSWTHHVLIQALFPCKSLRSVEEGSLCYAVGPCGWFYKSSVCMLIWTMSFLPALCFSSLGTVSFFWGTMSVKPFLFGKEVHVSPFLDST